MPAEPTHDEPLTAVDDADEIEQGGDAACWLGRVCDNCGALIEGSRGVPCWRCNTPWRPS
ncbi:MAG: hypothetical protein ABUT11_01280 [Leifsonia sp.]